MKLSFHYPSCTCINTSSAVILMLQCFHCAYHFKADCFMLLLWYSLHVLRFIGDTLISAWNKLFFLRIGLFKHGCSLILVFEWNVFCFWMALLKHGYNLILVCVWNVFIFVVFFLRMALLKHEQPNSGFNVWNVFLFFTDGLI
jgi:hypothetical protein